MKCIYIISVNTVTYLKMRLSRVLLLTRIINLRIRTVILVLRSTHF